MNIRVVYKAPGRAPEVREIENTLEALQACVGGYIETFTLSTDTVIICNEEGRLLGLPQNCEVCGIGFCGPILVAGVAGDEFASLSEEYTDFVMRRFGWLKEMDWEGEQA